MCWIVEREIGTSRVVFAQTASTSSSASITKKEGPFDCEKDSDCTVLEGPCEYWHWVNLRHAEKVKSKFGTCNRSGPSSASPTVVCDNMRCGDRDAIEGRRDIEKGYGWMASADGKRIFDWVMKCVASMDVKWTEDARKRFLTELPFIFLQKWEKTEDEGKHSSDEELQQALARTVPCDEVIREAKKYKHTEKNALVGNPLDLKIIASVRAKRPSLPNTFTILTKIKNDTDLVQEFEEMTCSKQSSWTTTRREVLTGLDEGCLSNYPTTVTLLPHDEVERDVFVEVTSEAKVGPLTFQLGFNPKAEWGGPRCGIVPKEKLSGKVIWSNDITVDIALDLFRILEPLNPVVEQRSWNY